MTKADTKQPYAVISRYKALYKSATGRTAELNVFKEKWAAADLIESFGYERVILALEYMFQVSDKVSWTYFTRNCEKILRYYDEVQADLADRMIARKLAKEWLSESRS